MSAGKYFLHRDTSSGSELGVTVGIALIALVVFLFFVLICVGYYRTSWAPGFTGTRSVIPRRSRPRRAPGLAKVIVESLPIVRFEDVRSRDVELGETIRGGVRDGSSRMRAVTAVKDVVEVNVKSMDDKGSRRYNKSGGIEATDISSTPSSLTAEIRGESNCSICLEDFVESEEIRLLPCDHKFHPRCVDPWLENVSGTCPVWFVKLLPVEM